MVLYLICLLQFQGIIISTKFKKNTLLDNNYNPENIEKFIQELVG